MSRQILQEPTPITGYYYTSFFALFLSPIGNLSEVSASFIWGVFQILLIVVFLFIISWGLPNSPSWKSSLYLFLLLTAYPILNNFKWGQVSVLITVAVICSFIYLRGNKPITSGIILAFVTAIKFYPVIFIVIYLIKRETRALGAFFIALLVFYFIFPVSVLGFSNWLEFEKVAGLEITGAGWISRDINSQYITHAGLRWFEIIFHRQGGVIAENMLTIIGIAIALSSMITAYWLEKQGAKEATFFSLIAIFTCIPFVIKTSWPHYFAYLPFCQGILFFHCMQMSGSSISSKGIVIFPLISMLLSNIFFFNLFPDWSVYNSYGVLFISNLLILLTLFSILASSFSYPQAKSMPASTPSN